MTERYPVTLDARKARHVLGFNRASALAGQLARTRLPAPALRAVIRSYAAFFKVDLDEMNNDLADFSSFDQFFVRELKPGLRPVEAKTNVMVSPSDGKLHNFGTIQGGRIPQVKGFDYSVADFLGNPAMAARFEGGTYATIYLSPRDYHRVHCPLDGSIAECRHIPGALYSVSPMFVKGMRFLFTTNERIPIYLDTEFGRVCIVMVGATVVGRITLSFSDLETNRANSHAVERFQPGLAIAKGDELGAFHLGSTVVILAEGQWKPKALSENLPVKMGMPLFESAY